MLATKENLYILEKTQTTTLIRVARAYGTVSIVLAGIISIKIQAAELTERRHKK